MSERNGRKRRVAALRARARAICMADPKKIGARLLAAREACGISQADLAESIGRTQRWLWDIEEGRSQGGCVAVTMVGHMLGIKPDQLYAK